MGAPLPGESRAAAKPDPDQVSPNNPWVADRNPSMSTFCGSIMDCTAHPLMKLTDTAANPSAVTPANRAGSTRSTSSAIGRKASRYPVSYTHLRAHETPEHL